MPENGRLYELMGELILEVKELRKDFNSRIERLEEEQRKTNILLQQHSRDLMNIANLLETRVVHWGDKAQIGSGTKRISGPIVKVK